MSSPTPGERWYGRLLRLYPRDFREEFGSEMTRLYRDRRREESVPRLWLSLIVDLVRTAPAEQLAMLAQDIRHAWRGLRRTPVITATAIATLALGVGATTVVFSVVYAVLLRPLPYPEPDRLIELSEQNLATGAFFRVSALNYLAWAERSRALEAVAAFNGTAATMTDAGEPERLAGSSVTASLFDVLRVSPIVGRTLQAEDEQPGSARVAVLSESLWRSRFGGDRQVIERSITLDGERHQVVGVMPAAFREVGRAQVAAATQAQVFLPMRIDRTRENRGNRTLRVVGRLHRGVTLDQARTEMRSLASGLAQEFPATNAAWGAQVETLSDTMLDPQVRPSLLLLLGVVSLVFLIVCTNVANLQLVRGTKRQSELAVRTALGARRSRLIRQLLTESACLSVVSGAAGVLVAAIAHPLLRPILRASLPRMDEMHLDVGVLAFGLLIALVSGLVFGIAPALRTSRFDVSESLMLVERATANASRVRTRHVLIATQVGLATMLLIGAALLVQGFIRLQRVPLGFQPDDVLTARLSLPSRAYPDPSRAGRFYQQLVDTLQASRRVGPAAVATSAPFAPGVRAAFRPTSRGQTPPADSETFAEHVVSAGYFKVLGMPLAGRTFNELDATGGAGVVIVSQRGARLLWPGQNPLGQALDRGNRVFEVIGVVGDVRGSDTQGLRGGGPDREPRAAVYFAATQMPQRTMTLLVRAPGGSASATREVREAVRQLDPTLALAQVRLLSDWLAEGLAPTRLTTTLAAAFAGIALLLTLIGIYGVLAYSVAARTREIGVRMAIGATRRSIIGLVVGDGMRWVGAGIAAGLISALAGSRFVASLLFETPARDPVTFAAVAGAVALVALMACSIPAVRAARISPLVAMRAE
jgi:putative ABC transport system permease protein